MLLYVYGTLRKKGALHKAMRDSNYLETVRVDNYKMVDLGAFPAAAPCNRSSIVCEKYKVSGEIIKSLDVIEDCPRLYERVNVSGVYLYVMHPWHASGFKRIECGDWIKYLKEKE